MCMLEIIISVYMCKESRQAGDNPCGLLIVAQSPVVSNFLQTLGTAARRPPCPSSSPGVCPSSCLLQWWCHPAISSSDALFSFCHQLFSASGTFPMSSLFTSSDQNTGASASVLLMSIQDWFPLRWTDLISSLTRGSLSSLLQHQSSKASILWCLFTVQLSQPYVTTGKTIALTITDLCQQSNISAFQHTV